MKLTAKQVASYFLSKDKDRKLFTLKVIKINDVKSYEGNVRINKYLFLAQVVYLAKYGKKLFNDEIVAYTNGPVIISIMNSFNDLYNDKDIQLNIDNKTKDFLDKIYISLENASSLELVDITHDDPEWKKLSENTYSQEVMNLDKHIDYYKETYQGLIEALHI